MVRDVATGVTGDIGAVRYVEDGVTKNVPVVYVVENSKTSLVFKANQNEYEFTHYEHEEPGGAVEVISADGSMITITVPVNNFGGTAFEFSSDIPNSAVGQDLTISLKLNASYSGSLTEYYDNIGVRCMEYGYYEMGVIYYTGVDTEYSYTVPGSDVVDRVELALYTYPEGDGETYTFTIKDVMVNGKPCIFNF